MKKKDKSDWVRRQRTLHFPIVQTTEQDQEQSATAQVQVPEKEPDKVEEPELKKARVSPAPPVVKKPDLSWTPQHVRDIVGNAKAKEDVQAWLKSRRFHTALLLSGPTGIGKSVLARAALRDAGFTALLECTSSAVLVDAVRRHPKPEDMGIVFDELDALEVSDRTALVKALKGLPPLPPPIICICDDAHDKSMDALREACTSVRMFRPFTITADAISLVRVLVREWNLGNRVSVATQRLIVDGSHGDLRRTKIALHWAARTDARIVNEGDIFYDSGFDGARALLSGGCKGDAAYHAAHDSLAPLLLHENYVGRADMDCTALALSDYDALDSHPMHMTHDVATIFLSVAAPAYVIQPMGPRDRLAFTRFFAHRPKKGVAHSEHAVKHLLDLLTPASSKKDAVKPKATRKKAK